MHTIRFGLFLVVQFIAMVGYAQEFDVNSAVSNYETLVATNQSIPAAKQSYKLGEYFLANEQFENAIKYFDASLQHAVKASNSALAADAAFKKGVAQKMYAETGRLSMAEEQQYFKDCIGNFKKADDFYTDAKKKGSKYHLYSLLYGGEALYIIGNYREAINPLKTVVRYAQKNRNEGLILTSSDLLAKNYDQLDDELNSEYYQSIYDSYYELKVSKDSLIRAQHQLKLSKDSLAKSQLILNASIDSLQRTQKSLKLTSESLSKSKDS
jgi:tetratricopeptide (TPR) repeat protein